MSQQSAELSSEFGLAGQAAADVEIPSATLSAVRRTWLKLRDGGHISAVIWGQGPADIVFLHEAGRSAREWDEVVLAAGRPAVAIDLPGHGRSSWRRDGRYQPRKIAVAVAEAVRSLAPHARLVVGSGLGGLTALALATTPRPSLLRQLVLVDTLPGIVELAAHEPRTGPERFASREEAAEFLADIYSKWPEASVHHEVAHELEQEQDGWWVWRHHPGNLPDPTGSQFDDLTLWEELAALAIPVQVIRGDRSARVNADVAAQLERRAPGVQLMTIQGAADVVAGQPAELAARLGRLITR
jgi:pimeloyl-ACP methyl ester carboxylesterase